MSGSLVDAIDKRRKGPDLSAVPGNLRGLLEEMLRPDPKQRLRSMDEVLARLGGTPAPPPPPTESASASVSQPVRSGGGPPKVLLVIGVLAVLIIIAAGVWYLFRDVGGVDPGKGNEIVENDSEPSEDPTETARSTINSVLPSVNCTWLDVAGIESGDDGLNIALRGVAGDATAAQREITQALSGAGLEDARLDFGDVAPITPAGCAALDTYRQIRASSDYRLSVPQSRFEMVMQPPGTPYAGENAANAVISFNFGGAGSDFAILGIEPSGAIAPLIGDRNNFEQVLEQSVGGRPIFDEGNGRYRLNIDLDHQGWSGIILVSGQGPFDPATVAPPFGSRGPAWQQQFLSAAAEKNWRVEMVWFESVNRVSGDSAPAAGNAGTTPAEDDKEP
jgi:serine/threonine-protein kinase